MITAEQRTRVESWIDFLRARYNRITTEREIDCLLWPTHVLSPDGETLLQILGYAEGEVTPQETVKSRSKPDFVVRKNGSPVLVIDDKKPKENLDEFADQVVLYLRRLKAPLGVLFNGHDLKVLINTDLKELERLTEFRGEWVAEVTLDDSAATVALLSDLSSESLASDPVAVAKALAAKRRVDRRKEEIGVRLQDMLDSPPAQLLDAMIKCDARLAALKTTSAELSEAWAKQAVLAPTENGNPAESVIRATHGINPTIRRKVAELCTRYGWKTTKDLIINANIKRLNIREDGRTEKGYNRVEPWAGVPEGLCIQGVDGTAGQRIIESLDKLLGQRSDG